VNCRRARRLLARDRFHEARQHLAACPSCARLADRWAETERALASRRVRVTPPADFARRVVARLSRPEDLVGWAALRLLPATLVLVLLLSWLNLRAAGTGSGDAADPADAVLSWVLDPAPDGGSGS
jgi:predicted anti-sigma-YlaC factor YlaD